jgi:predicted dehydrogenase
MTEKTVEPTAPSQSSRRAFLATGVGTAATFTIVPRHVLGGPGFLAPSETVNLAGIGVGGAGAGAVVLSAKCGANVVAVCDVNSTNAEAMHGRYPKSRVYKDFREMIDKEAKHIDVVTVGTPDHTHAVATMAAIRAGKHVFTQKPLTHTIYEARMLTKAARDAGVATQMGNQGHAEEGARRTNEIIQSGLIGEVREVHCWSDRAGLNWKQGIDRPKDTPPVPKNLDWDLWLGPVRERPYNPAYAPVWWRGWWDFGTGALGDMGCHILDHPIWALKLGAPSVVETRITLDGSKLPNGERNFETYPVASLIYFEFPARGDLPPVNLTWYEGGLMPPTPAEMPANESLPGNGVLYIGSKGKLYHASHGGKPSVLPIALREEAKKVPKTIKRSAGHFEEWIDACKGGPPAMSNFDYAGPLTETMLLGILACRVPGQRLEWDSENMKVKNAPELNQHTHIEYRKGWTL